MDDKEISVQLESQRELLELMIKVGRRCAHDLAHAADDIKDPKWHKIYRERSDAYLAIFYPDSGPKNYRAKLHEEIDKLECILNTLCRLTETSKGDYEILVNTVAEKFDKKKPYDTMPF